MTSMTKHTLIDCFSLRARIGWQGLRSDEFKTEGPYLVTGVDFHNGRVDWDDCYHVTEERYAQDKGIQLYEHDLLITKDGTIGKTAVVIDCPEKATLNSGVFVVRAINNEVVPEFLHYVLHSHWFDLFVRNVLTGSTIKHLNQEKFYKFSFEAPDVPTQKKIVEVLESIDAVIDKTRETVEKYECVKKGLIFDLLTNGIDESGVIRTLKTHKYKESPVGLIPEEWVCKRFDKVMPLQRGFDLPGSKRIPGEYPVACSNGIVSYHASYTTKGPCVWTGRSGTIGNVFYSEDNCWIHNTSLWVTNFNGNNAKFIYYLLGNFHTAKWASGTGVPTLNRNDLHYQMVALPTSVTEQVRIVERLSSIEVLLDNEKEQLQKYLNIKNGLMSDLLSGNGNIAVLA